MDQLPEDLAAGLPPQHDEEPSSLRQDIVDELRDHLECAIRREQFRGATDDQSVWKRVVAQFGDPRVVASKLYWLAMWRQVMRQKIVLAGGAAMLALGIAMTAFMWLMLQQQQQMVQQQLASADRQQANFEAMLNRFAAPPSTIASLKVHLDRPAKVALSGGSLTAPIEGIPESLTDAKGAREFDFGNLLPGLYSLSITADNWEGKQKLLVRSGEAHVEQVQVPFRELSELKLTNNLPASYAGTIPVAVVDQQEFFHDRGAWTRDEGGPNFALVPGTESTVYPGVIGPAIICLRYETKPFSLAAISGVLLMPSEAHKSFWRSSETAHTMPIQLQQGANHALVEVPGEWIAKEKREAERRLDSWKPRVREEVRRLLAKGLQDLSISPDSASIKRRIVFAGIDTDAVALNPEIEAEIKASSGFELVDNQMIKPVVDKLKSDLQTNDPEAPFFVDDYMSDFCRLMKTAHLPFEFVLVSKLGRNQSLELIRVHSMYPLIYGTNRTDLISDPDE